MKYLILMTSILLFAMPDQAQEDETELKSAKEDPLRCERFVKSNLKELKSKMQEYCDLNKPFSTSLAINIGEEHYLYCCHKKNK